MAFVAATLILFGALATDGFAQRMVEPIRPEPMPAPMRDVMVAPPTMQPLPDFQLDRPPTVPLPPPEARQSIPDSSGGPDQDGDGWTDSLDCNDSDRWIYPGAFERLNGIDDDCDGRAY